MTNLNISMPDSMKAYVEAQAANFCFSSAGDYINHLINMDKERKDIEKQAKLAQYLALCEAQIARGEVKTWNREDFLRKVEADYNKKSTKI